MSSPRWNGGFINETAICEALTNLSQCEAETECKEMAKGILYTTASVREIFYSTLLNENENFSSFISNFIQNPQPAILIVPESSLRNMEILMMMIFPNLELVLPSMGHLTRNSASKINILNM